jgi:hypothetical protein
MAVLLSSRARIRSWYGEASDHTRIDHTLMPLDSCDDVHVLVAFRQTIRNNEQVIQRRLLRMMAATARHDTRRSIFNYNRYQPIGIIESVGTTDPLISLSLSLGLYLSVHV